MSDITISFDREPLAREIAELVLEEVRRHTAPEFLDVQGAAEYLVCSPQTIYDRVRTGKIPHHREGGSRLLFSRRELADYVLEG